MKLILFHEGKSSLAKSVYIHKKRITASLSRKGVEIVQLNSAEGLHSYLSEKQQEDFSYLLTLGLQSYKSSFQMETGRDVLSVLYLTKQDIRDIFSAGDKDRD